MYRILHITSSHHIDIDFELTKSKSLEEFKKEFAIGFKKYINKPFESDIKDKEMLQKLDHILEKSLNFNYNFNPHDLSETWIGQLVFILRDEVFPDFYPNKIAEECWPCLTLAEFDISEI